MLEILETPITVLHIVVALFVVLIVLIQPGKSGGIGAALGGAGAQQVFGGRGAGNFLSRLTWISGGIFFATSVALAYVSSSTDDSLAKRGDLAKVVPLDSPEPATQPEKNEGASTTPDEAEGSESEESSEPGRQPLEQAESEPNADSEPGENPEPTGDTATAKEAKPGTEQPKNAPAEEGKPKPPTDRSTEAPKTPAPKPDTARQTSPQLAPTSAAPKPATPPPAAPKPAQPQTPDQPAVPKPPGAPTAPPAPPTPGQ